MNRDMRQREILLMCLVLFVFCDDKQHSLDQAYCGLGLGSRGSVEEMSLRPATRSGSDHPPIYVQKVIWHVCH